MLRALLFAVLGASLVLPAARHADAGLVSELGCPVCHTDLDAGTDIRSKAPPLGDAGRRYRPAYLFEYLRAPRSVRRHIGAARMPDFGLADDEALALVAFLADQRNGPSTLPALPDDLDAPLAPDDRIHSEEEFSTLIGTDLDCLACHTRGDAGGVLGPDLAGAGARLQPAWMRRFLAAPSAWGVEDGVMPALFLRGNPGEPIAPVSPDSIRQLRQIVDYLERSGAETREHMEQAYEAARQQHPSITAAQGAHVFDALGCRGCHVGVDDARPIEPAPDLRREHERVQAGWLGPYLSHPWAVRPFGSRPGNGARMPDFGLSTDEVDRLVAELGAASEPAPVAPAEADPLTAYQREKARRLLEHRLACLGCHRLDGEGGRIGPDLTNAASRLRPSFVEEMIDDPAAAAPHATMPRLPLDPATRHLLVRYLTEARAPTETSYLSLIENDTIPLPPEPGAPRDYARYCAPCHGADGRADGFNARFLPTSPTRHADASHMQLRADSTLFDGIAAGGGILDRSPRMPAWGETLSPSRIDGLVAHMRSLCDCSGPFWATHATPSGERILPAAPERTHPALLSAHDTVSFDDFLGARACAECHAREYEVWSQSTHAHAGGRPGWTDVIARFDGKPRQFRDGTFRPVKRGHQYIFEVRQEGEEPIDIRVAAVIGGGHMVGGGTQAFFAEMLDGTFRMLPFDFHRGSDTWFVQRRSDGHWTPIGPDVGFDELTHWPPFRAIGNMPRLSHCENCHGSQILVQYDETTREFETRWKTLGIDCEACHGPGREHAQWARSEGRDENPDIAIDSLAVLDKHESLQVCFRCHANKQVMTNEWLAGMDPQAHFAPKLPMLAQGAYLVDGRINGFGYQQNHLFSDCFVEGSMVCTDCHDPHSQSYRDVNRRPLVGRLDDAQCTGCHASKKRDGSAHTHHAADSAGSRCVACHMPYLQHQAVGDELAFARSDHTIPIPRPVFDESIGIQNACSNCHEDRSTAQLQEDVDAWWGPLKPHHPMIARILDAEDVSESEAAAVLLLAPEEAHGAAQMAGASAFVRDHVQSDAPLGPTATERLLALADAPDPDVAAVALAGLHIGNPEDPRVARRLERARTDEGTRGEGLRNRWRYALTDLLRLQQRRGAVAEADRIRALRGEIPKRRPVAP